MNYMKKYVLLLGLLFTAYVQSQIISPLNWNLSVEKISETEYNLIAIANIQEGWHLYSQKSSQEDGPLPTNFSFDKSPDFALVGICVEDKGHTEYDETFETNITYFSNKATFKQKVKLVKPITSIEAKVSYMCCSDIQCTPPLSNDLVFNIKKSEL
ncbi:protein-disulfide reductase DsbD domain-containing protein [Tamlana sp. 2201CG12-4]|uniref:protein-disulfide reductase DsbD domain-containing protein n=1 Tax=Tamlana sp. 2201CG12-4 TaxID=3112582 RepID=UPI002DBCDB2F|nr:protein-disulfide reductase DsbD domain-containing protein [Tamlana sp. 2201CG12-4]MEC3908835.1 protein-disulfide reductase DsbD domain-containing protein [Tamlana sp. 2201CG12-4]